MKQSLVITGILLVLGLCFTLPTVLAASKPEPTQIISKPEGIEPKQKGVLFSHVKHESLKCIECHHTSAEDDVTQGCKDAGCHDMFVVELPEQRRDIRYFEKAYHDMCSGCHRELRRQEKPFGPIDCKGCHTQE